MSFETGAETDAETETETETDMDTDTGAETDRHTDRHTGPDRHKQTQTKDKEEHPVRRCSNLSYTDQSEFGKILYPSLNALNTNKIIALSSVIRTFRRLPGACADVHANGLPLASPRRPCPWQDGRTPLHMAARKGHRAVVEELLAAKAKVDATDKVVP